MITEFKLCRSRFKIRKAEHGKRNNVERLFKGEAYRPYRLRYNTTTDFEILAFDLRL
ncbi:MAG: hypothetical protein LBH59_01035 [Planctomycetaceae bacterium]|nr:hypothetical protein [Planctomycetaceae bacterium]